jgi:hypothetical protein
MILIHSVKNAQFEHYFIAILIYNYKIARDSNMYKA